MPENNATSLPTPEQSIAALRNALKTVHPANIEAGIFALIPFIAAQMQDGAIEEMARQLPRNFAAQSGGGVDWPDQEEFHQSLLEYATVLHAVHAKLFEYDSTEVPGWIEAADEVARIAMNLGANVYLDDVRDDGLVGAFSNDPISTYLVTTDAATLLQGKHAATESKIKQLHSQLGSLEKRRTIMGTVEENRTNAFDLCSRVNETLVDLGYMAQETVSRMLARLNEVKNTCFHKMNPEQRSAADALGRQLSKAAAAFEAK